MKEQTLGCYPLTVAALGFHQDDNYKDTGAMYTVTEKNIFDFIVEKNSQRIAHSAREQRTREIECEICNHKATTRAHLREHLKTHSEEKTHVCHVCKAAYKHISSLYRHYGQKHK
ncbi:hypothetical protein DPMN_124818 [Dreissena polymorpha]|uniref:C2H2-type domain-containing protein n=1 Tax=Dreissena polymorpha TaxID=45954 RepID=A0A9D4JWJ7_DREPO|nr:hypothetical protein DPMN_124818 [Dreissena polymorpha]